MKVLLRHRKTRLYYAGMRQWSAEITRAVQFRLSSDAIRHASELQLGDAEVVFLFPDQELHYALPIKHVNPVALRNQ